MKLTILRRILFGLIIFLGVYSFGSSKIQKLPPKVMSPRAVRAFYGPCSCSADGFIVSRKLKDHGSGVPVQYKSKIPCLKKRAVTPALCSCCDGWKREHLASAGSLK